jgi:hypothetical protein
VAVWNTGAKMAERNAIHPRDRRCESCGALPGEPCRTRTGKILEDVHCTIRVVGHPVEPVPEQAPEPPAAGPTEARPPTTGVPDNSAGPFPPLDDGAAFFAARKSGTKSERANKKNTRKKTRPAKPT